MEFNDDVAKVAFSEPQYYAYRLYFTSEMNLTNIDLLIKSKNVYDETVNSLKVEFEIYKSGVLKVLEIKELWGLYDNKAAIYKFAEEFAKKLENKKEKRQSLEIILKKFLTLYFAKMAVYCEQSISVLKPVYKEIREIKKQQLKTSNVPHEVLTLQQAEDYKKKKEMQQLQQPQAENQG